MFHKFIKEHIKGGNVSLFVLLIGPKNTPPLVLLYDHVIFCYVAQIVI